MPTQAIGYAGVKVVTIAPANPAAGHPKIQGVYSLFEAEHLTPLAVMDAVELTLVRTPATTALAVKHMVAADPARTHPPGTFGGGRHGPAGRAPHRRVGGGHRRRRDRGGGPAG